MIPHTEFAYLNLIRFYSPNLKRLKHYIYYAEVYREFCGIEFPNLEKLDFASCEYKKRVGGLGILVNCLKKGNIRNLRLELDSYIFQEVDKISLTDLPALEKLCMSLKLFGSLNYGQTFDNLKSLELSGDTSIIHCAFQEKWALQHVFRNVKFIGLKFLSLDRCLFSTDTLNLIDKSAPMLEYFVIEGGDPGDDDQDDIAEFMDDPANFKNLKYFSMNRELVRRY